MLIHKFNKSLVVFLYPKYWFTDSDYVYSAEFDKWINQKLNEGEVPKVISDCKVYFAGRVFWHYIWGPGQWHLHESGYDEVRPSRTTQARLERALKKSRKAGIVNSKWRKNEKD